MGKYEPETKLRSTRKNGQVEQPFIENPPDNNGWPEPLTDPSSPYRIAVNDGKNGEVSNMDPKISQDIWHLPEGEISAEASPEADGQDGQRASGDNVSQKIWSDPAGSGAVASQPDVDGDAPVRSADPFKTSQMDDKAHDKPEGNFGGQ